jgi:hypothetical protein
MGYGVERWRHWVADLRSAGAYPPVLGRLVREWHWLTLPEAVRGMTSL